MTKKSQGRVAIVYPGDRQTRLNAKQDNNRFANLFAAFRQRGIDAVPAVYHDDFCDEVKSQLLTCNAVLVWVNPIQDGHDRKLLDAMLCEVAAQGIFVSTHPDIILKLGTKKVLFDTRNMGWGSDTYWYNNLAEMQKQLPVRLAKGEVRIIKRHRGNGGDGVWQIRSVENVNPTGQLTQPNDVKLSNESTVIVRHAKRGCQETTMPLGEFYQICKGYFSEGEGIIDQAFQTRLAEGMVRCYLVKDHVGGFGVQAVNALYPAGKNGQPAPQPGPRLYYPPTLPEWQRLKNLLENKWVAEMCDLLKIERQMLPVLWDCDFLLGEKDSDGNDTYVLCEINVSSVAPYPESVVELICDEMEAVLRI